jgi:HD-GYP domain-containing protein (c-di-GMP phosphodiesterase class II)
MTSTAKNLTTQSEQTSDAVLALTSIDSLLAWALIDAKMSIYKPTLGALNDQAIHLTKDGLNLTILGVETFQQKDKMDFYFANGSLEHHVIICAGTESELQLLAPAHIGAGALTLGLPASTSSVLACLNTASSLLNTRETTANLKHVMGISKVLNGERDIPKLLTLILYKAREICKADAGSIYTLHYAQGSSKVEDAKLTFRFTQNASIKADFAEFSMPIDNKSIVGNAVLKQKSINIPDLYSLSDDPTKNELGVKHNRTFDIRSGYESHSMLTLPMFDISHRVIGVIQLINRKRDWEANLLAQNGFKEQVVPFHQLDEEYAGIVAQQAGIALENAAMHDEIQKLFDGFVNASVTAIEQRDPTTSGHSHRVAVLTTGLAQYVDASTEGKFRDIKFSDDQMREIKYASLLHDFGKLGVRENVLIKAKKLYPWQYDSVLERFELIRATLEIENLKQQVNFLTNPSLFPMDFSSETFAAIKDQRNAELDDFYNFILKANEPTVLEQGGFERLNEIAKLGFQDSRGNRKSYLTPEELKSLSVSRGSLTSEEFAEIQSHVDHTYEFLRKIPWGHRLFFVPEIAAKHHEKLDGSGYPHHAVATQIPIQSRIMTIADIYDALTASDRPYKKAVSPEKALDIINMDVTSGKIDSDLYGLFISSGVYKTVLNK